VNEAAKSAEDYRDLLAAVGQVLLEWGYLEQEMEKWMTRLPPSTPNRPKEGKATVLASWQRAATAFARDPTAREDLVAEVKSCLRSGTFWRMGYHQPTHDQGKNLM
jgi:hypothetical protein